MTYRCDTASPAATPSPSSSTNASPYIDATPLDSMTNTSEDQDSSSTHGTPNHSTTSLPRTQTAGKGGCWTCRVRRKKCDEQREGDSCKTCKRLTIKCLGWGPKRPDWMRDKKAVDDYKANIKAQLSRAGLIRGQPRVNAIQVSPKARQSNQPSSTPRRSTSSTISRATTTSVSRSSTVKVDHSSPFVPPHQLVETPFNQATYGNHLISAVPGPALTYEPLSYEEYESTYYANQPSAYQNALGIDTISDPPLSLPQTAAVDFMDARIHDYSMQAQPTMQDLVVYYFSNVRQIQFLFAGDVLNELTYTAVVSEPQGAVSLALCALADFHLRQLRVAQGLEPPSQTQENSMTSYLRLEVLSRLEINKNAQHCWSENDALAALHLISLSQLSGGTGDWETPFDILSQWLRQTNLPAAENPWMAFLSLSPLAQLTVKAALWVDIFSSLSQPQPPKFLSLWQSLLNWDQTSFWMNGSDLELRRLRMDLLTGCPDEAMLAIAETSSLAQWKATQLRNDCLSCPDLIRRGVAIEQQLHRHRPTEQQLQGNDTVSSRLLNSTSAVTLEDNCSLTANIFREAAALYLHTVLSNPIPGVPEISASVDTLIQLFSRLPPSDLDRGLIFPICLAACMTNDSTRRDFFKNRIHNLNESFGNLLQIRRLMEAIWRKRDISGKETDLCESIQEQGLKLLLI